jgi:flagellar biosynthesis/type III secretory pathway protein FliH
MERILKAGSAAAAWPRRRITAQAWQAGERAAVILADAEAEAAALRREAEEGRAAVRAAAERAGRAEGLAQAAAALAGAAAARDRWLAEAEGDVAGLALEVARRLVGRELAADPGAVVGVAREALRAARGRRRVALRLHPASAAALREASGELGALAAVPSVALVEDPALDPGDVVVETEAGEVDGRLAARLEAFRQALAAGGGAPAGRPA